jgi:hypothetical protein
MEDERMEWWRVGGGAVHGGLGMSSWCSGLMAILGWVVAGVVDDKERYEGSRSRVFHWRVEIRRRLRLKNS